MSGRSSYIARLIARNEPDALFEQRRTERTPALQPREESEARPVMDDPFEAVEVEADLPPTPAPRQTGEKTPPTPAPTVHSSVRRADLTESLDDSPDDAAKTVFVSPAERPIETHRIEPPRQERAPAVTRGDAGDDDDTPMTVAEHQGEAPRRIDAPEQDSRNPLPTSTDDDVEIAAPVKSPWTFEEILAPFLKQFQAPNAGENRDEIHADVPPQMTAASLEEDDAPNSAYDRMLPVIEADVPSIMPITEKNAAIVNIGDIVIEVTPPRTPDPTPRRNATAPPAPPRLGVRSKRGFGLGQM